MHTLTPLQITILKNSIKDKSCIWKKGEDHDSIAMDQAWESIAGKWQTKHFEFDASLPQLTEGTFVSRERRCKRANMSKEMGQYPQKIYLP